MRVLVIAQAWVGDLVMLHSVIQLLAARQPAAAIDVLGPPWARELIERMPGVDRAIPWSVGHGEAGLWASWKLGKELRAAGYGWAVVVPRSIKSALLPFFARIPRRTGFRGEPPRSLLLNDTHQDPGRRAGHWVQRVAALVLPAGESVDRRSLPPPVLRVDEDRQRVLLDELRLDGVGRPIFGLVPGASYGPAKRWPISRFQELARRLVADGSLVWIFGSREERALGEQIVAEGDPSLRNLCGETTLADVADLMGLCTAVVSNDSGLLHVAAGVGTHVVAIYGSSTPHYSRPLASAVRVHWLDLECSPCFAKECPLGHLRCLKEIEVDSILEDCREVLE